MHEHALIAISSTAVLGAICQWFAWRLKIPAILLLLVVGIVVGPVTGMLVPDETFGDLIFPFVSLSVAIILFEGGLNLKMSEIRSTSREIFNLVTIGALVTFVATASFAILLLDLPQSLCWLLGAILVVTGPTVVIPLLRQVRPSGNVGALLKWEGIVIDPLGVLLGVLTFEAIVAGGLGELTGTIIAVCIKAGVFGTLLGVGGAYALIMMLKNYLIPDYLINPITLCTVVGVFALANSIQHESGLVTVTVMGVVLANQQHVSINHLIQFKEDLRVLLISMLFILLAARVDQSAIYNITMGQIAFVAALIFIIRPLTVFVSTFRSSLTLKEKLFLSSVAPRGIVAATISSIFALDLASYQAAGETAFVQANDIVNITFLVIVCTVVFYSLTAKFSAKILGLASPVQHGMLILGAHAWARELAKCLRSEGVLVRLIDTNSYNINSAKRDGLLAQNTNIFLDHEQGQINLGGTGKLLALTANEEINSLATLHFSDIYGWADVYSLISSDASGSQGSESIRHIRGRQLFGELVSFQKISSLFSGGGQFISSDLADEQAVEKFKEKTLEEQIPLFFIENEGIATPIVIDKPYEPSVGSRVISLSLPDRSS